MICLSCPITSLDSFAGFKWLDLITLQISFVKSTYAAFWCRELQRSLDTAKLLPLLRVFQFYIGWPQSDKQNLTNHCLYVYITWLRIDQAISETFFRNKCIFSSQWILPLTGNCSSYYRGSESPYVTNSCIQSQTWPLHHLGYPSMLQASHQITKQSDSLQSTTDYMSTSPYSPLGQYSAHNRASEQSLAWNHSIVYPWSEMFLSIRSNFLKLRIFTCKVKICIDKHYIYKWASCNPDSHPALASFVYRSNPYTDLQKNWDWMPITKTGSQVPCIFVWLFVRRLYGKRLVGGSWYVLGRLGCPVLRWPI